MSCHFYRWGFWLRLGTSGKGIAAKWDAWQGFSERNGFRKTFRVGKLMIERLEVIK